MTPPPTTLPPNQGRILGDADVPSLLARTKRIAVLGIKTEAQHGQPAFDVPRYLDAAGFELVHSSSATLEPTSETMSLTSAEVSK